MTKPQYLDHLCDTAVRFLDVREPEKKFKDLMTKAFRSLRSLVDDPTSAGLPDPNQTPPLEPIGQKRSATTTVSRENPRTAKAKTALGSYAEAITGKSASLTLPFGAKSAPPKTPAKYASGAIGAAVPPKGKPKAKAKSQGGSTPIGASSKVKQGTAKGKVPVITSDSALEYLRNAPNDQSFDEYQYAQDTSAQPDIQTTQTVQDDQNVPGDQTDQDEQVARAVQADLDAQAALDATAVDPDQPGNLPDWDENDDAAMQQALVLSKQHTQSQGSDPQAASSTGAGQSTDQELNHELQVGIEYQTEVQNLQMKMTRGILHPDDVARYRTVSKLWSDNQARVAELFDRQVQENLNRQSQSTKAMLGSLKPLNISRAKAPTIKPPPSSKDSTGASTTSAPGKQGGTTDASKAHPPISGSGRPVAVKTLPQGPPAGPLKGTNPGPKSVPIQGGLPAPASPKGSSQSHLIGKNVSPRGNPPPRVLRRPSGPSSIADGQTPRSVASEATAVLEEKLRKKKEAKRTRQDEQAEVYRDDREKNKQQRSHHHQQEHRHTRVLDEEIGHQVNDHHPLILRMMTIDHPHQGVLDLEDVNKTGVIGQGLTETRGRNVEDEAHLMRRKGHDLNADRVNIDHPKREGGIPPLHHNNEKRKGMRRTGISPGLPSQSRQRRRNLRTRHHCHHQILFQRQPRRLQLNNRKRLSLVK